MDIIKTIYIYHDCFVVKTSEAVLVFDFWKDPYRQGPLPNPLMEVDREIPVYVFVSHGHKDHYNPEIFRWAKHFPNIRYIVSKDVRKRINHIVTPGSSYKGDKVDSWKVIAMSDNDNYEDGTISVKSFPSTDTGNSYAVKIGGRTIFHAGDLNAWIWKDESTEEEVKEALDSFNAIIDIIAESFSEFDICFFPVDSRIGTDYFTGARIFLERFKIGNFFPMHYELGDDVSSIARLHRDAATIDRYASPTCHHYIMSAPYSAYALI
ncbi:MAG: MBL fold metallo-hydrolase [Muribaculaceae bacterium]|nr:MBL fold metallo-hydrolase [Muribaculaceae bacterium]